MQAARVGNMVLGLWVFASAFLWPHTDAQFTNTWMVGVAVAVIAAAGLSLPSLRYLNTVAGAWLALSAFALPVATAATQWNNFLVGLAVLGLSLVESRPVQFGPRSRRVASVEGRP
jgi:hypothetical protein